MDSSPTLGNLIYVARAVALVEVEKVNDEKQVVVFRKTMDLKGKLPQARLLNAIKDARNPQVAKSIMNWAKQGRPAVCFATDSSMLIYTGKMWYESAAGGTPGWWLTSRPRPELDLAYVGTVQKLRQAVVAVIEKKPFVVTAVSLRNHRSEAYDDAAFGREFSGGSQRDLWRIRVALDMPGLTISLVEGEKNSQWIAGEGAGSAENVPPLLASLQSADADVRADAAEELQRLGTAARSATPALEKLLADPSVNVRIRAAAALEKIDAGNSSANSALISICKDPAAPRRDAVEAISEIGPQSPQIVAALMQLLEDGDAALRESAVIALGSIGHGASDAVARLIQLLDNKDLAAPAAWALGRIGPAARDAVPPLIAKIRGEQGELRWVAAVALLQIDATQVEPAIPVFIDGLRSGDEHTRWNARHCFVAMGDSRLKAAPLLLQMLNDPMEYVQWNAAQVLGTFGADLRGSVPIFIDMLNSRDRSRRLDAIHLLRSTGADAKASIPMLEHAAMDPDAEIQKAARQALKTIRG